MKSLLRYPGNYGARNRTADLFYTAGQLNDALAPKYGSILLRWRAFLLIR